MNTRLSSILPLFAFKSIKQSLAADSQIYITTILSSSIIHVLSEAITIVLQILLKVFFFTIT